MDPSGIVDALRAVGPRSACSDGERRAAKLLARELRAAGRRPRTETFWVRPQWPAVWLVHALLGLAGSVVSVSAPAVGLGLAGAAALSALVELGGRARALSLLWPRRATQNVRSDGFGDAPVRLLVTAAYDAPRSPSPFAAPLAALDRALRRATAGRWPAPLALLTLALVALAGCAGARLGGVEATWLGVVQLVPSVVCITATAILADLGLARPDLGDHRAASAPAAALALVAALDARPPRRLEVDVVLCGAGDAEALGMRHHVRAHPAAPERIAVVHLGPCSADVATRGGPVLSLAFHPDLVGAARDAGFRPHADRGWSGAVAARRAGWPAVALGGGEPEDPQATADRCVALVRRLDAALAGRTA